MTKKAKISVKFQNQGKEKIEEKAIYLMNLIGSDSDNSSEVEKKVHKRSHKKDKDHKR